MLNGNVLSEYVRDRSRNLYHILDNFYNLSVTSNLSAIGALFFLIGGIYRMIPRQFECTFLIVYKSELHFQRKTMKDMQHMKFF